MIATRTVQVPGTLHAKAVLQDQRIAERATLFVHDSLFHVDALTDSSKVEFRIMERYTNFFNGTAHTSR